MIQLQFSVLLLGLIIACNLSLGRSQIVQQFEYVRTFHDGAKPSLTIWCGTQCAQSESCRGFEVLNELCFLLTSATNEITAGSWKYMLQDENIMAPGCPPIAARGGSGSSLYIFFANENRTWKFSFGDTADILSGTYSSVKYLTRYIPDLNGTGPDAAFKYDNDVFLFGGENISVNDYAAGQYVIKPEYPRTIIDEIQTSPCPSSVNAATLLGNILYLLSNDIMYSYTISGSAPNIVYVYMSHFDMTVNSAANPFSALPGSPMSAPPSGLKAIAYNGDGSAFVGFAGKSMYQFTSSIGFWEYKGAIITPCEIPTPPPCPPVASRGSYSKFYLFFDNDNRSWKYRFSDTPDILAGTYYSEKFLDEYHPDLNGMIPDAAFNNDYVMFFFKGAYVEAHESGPTTYNILPQYPRLIIDEIKTSPIPSSVNAAVLFDNQQLYLLSGDIMYSYNISGSAPNIVYVYVSHFDMTVNGASNPFSALPGSPMSTPPTGLTAMVFKSDGTVMLAFAGTQMYEFTTATGYWEDKGIIKTPCNM